jgi:hypothetical protein
LKFISKETQLKIDLHLQTMQEKIVELENQLSISRNEKLAVNKAWHEEKNRLEQANAKLAEEIVALKEQLHDSANGLSSFQTQVADEQYKFAETKANLLSANAKLNEVKVTLTNKDKEVESAKAEASKFSQSLEMLHAENLKVSNAHANELKSAKDEAVKSISDLKGQLETVQKSLIDASAKFTGQAKELGDAKAALTTANEQHQQLAKSLEDKVAILSKQKDDVETLLKNEKSQHEGALINQKLSYEAKLLKSEEGLAAKLKQAQADHDAKLKSLTDEAEKVSQSLKADRDKHAKQAQQTEAKYDEAAQENELLSLQLMQAHEELVEYYAQKNEFEKLYQTYKARWYRLEKRLPNYLDYGVIEIVDIDNLSEVPTITWRVKDFAQAGVAWSDFCFATCLQNGHPGIGLLKESGPQLFVPKLLSANKDQLNLFMSMGSTEFRQIAAAISILNQLEAGSWHGFDFPAQFDLPFWRPSLKALISQVPALPAMLRYDAVKLKRELINPDYEHLWLEFNGLNLGNLNWKKFEIRLGAALVQSDGFSQYPKFEIPLIDGKTKPFESWFAESHDDIGAKLELRFALDKNVFDAAVWSKLSELDKALLLRLIYAMPDALKRLETNKTVIHRSWKTWVEFAAGAVKVLEANKALANKAAVETGTLMSQNASQAALPSPTAIKAKPLLQDETPVTLAAPTAIKNKATKSDKVINISNKAPAKPTAKVARKTKT